MHRPLLRPLLLAGILLAATMAVHPVAAEAKNGKGPGSQQERHDRSGSHVERHADDDDRGRHSSRNGSDAEIERWWQELPQDERDRYRQRYDELRKLPPEQRERLRGRWQHFRDLPPDQQDKLRKRYQRWQELPPAEREQLRQTWRHFRQLPPDQQERLKKELRSLRDLPEGERERHRQELHRRYFPDLPPSSQR